MAEDEKKVNSEEELDVSKRKEIDEIMNGFYNLAGIYSAPSESKREKELREKEERRRSREMEAIKEDIERRYTLHYENAVSNAEEAGAPENRAVGLNPGDYSENLDGTDEKLPDLLKIAKDNEEAATVKKNKKSVKNKTPERIELEDKSLFYRSVYLFGDVITRVAKEIFVKLISILLFPFKRTFSFLQKIGLNIRRSISDSISATLKEITFFRREIKGANRNIRRCIRRPLSLPGVLRHYIVKAFSLHRGLLKTFVNIALPVLSVAALVMVFGYWKDVTYALEVVYNNKSIGYISDESVFMEAREMVIDRLSAGKKEGDRTVADADSFDASYHIALVSLDKLNDSASISDKMIENSVENFTNACGVYINGKFICAVKNEADAKTVFYSILAPLEEAAEKGNYIVGFVEDIDYVQGLYRDDAGVMWDASKLEQTVLGRDGATISYSVEDGDTIESVAYEFASTPEEIYSLNPGLEDVTLHTGDTIFVPSYNRLVNIKKVVTSTSTREIEFDTVMQRDATKYSGYRVTRQQGVKGKERIITTKTYVNGELDNTEYAFETISKPTDEIIVVGSRTTYGGIYIGEASSKGFLWPAPSCHYISSPYGWRSTGWHKGVDLCTGNGTAYGSPVIAAKSGRVEVADYAATGYGYYVLINHGDGYKTRYAHMIEGSITVQAGEYVEAGQSIGKVGSTGNSSGPHLHFEVICNGEDRDPMEYIS